MTDFLWWMFLNGITALCFALIVHGIHKKEYVDIFIFLFALLQSLGISIALLIKILEG